MISSPAQNRKRWIIFGTLALMYILAYFYRVSLAVVAGDLSRELHLTPEQLGTLSGVLFYIYAAAQLPLGPMIDRLGSRVVISGCGVLTTVGGILFSQADTLAGAMVARMLIGVGTASVLMATFTLFSHWFSKQEFGRVSGFMVALGNLGNVVGTAPLALAVGAYGWRNSFLVAGIIQGIVTLLVFTMVQDKPVSNQSRVEAESPPKTGMMAAWREIFGTRDFWLLGAMSFAWYGNYLALQALWGGHADVPLVRVYRRQLVRRYGCPARLPLLQENPAGGTAGTVAAHDRVPGVGGDHTAAAAGGGVFCYRPCCIQRGDDLSDYPFHVPGRDRWHGPDFVEFLCIDGSGGNPAGHGDYCGGIRRQGGQHVCRGAAYCVSVSGCGVGARHRPVFPCERVWAAELTPSPVFI